MRDQELQEDAAQRVIAAIEKTQKLPPGSVNIHQTFQELKIDSLDGINILFALESEFKIDIPDDEARKIVSVKDAVDGVEKLLAVK